MHIFYTYLGIQETKIRSSFTLPCFLFTEHLKKTQRLY